MLVVVLHFIFGLHFVAVLHLLFFFIHIFFSTSSLTFRGLSPGFYTHFILSAKPIAAWFSTLSSWSISLYSCRKRYGLKWTFFTHVRVLPYAPSPTFYPAFIKAWANSTSMKFGGFHTDDPRNIEAADHSTAIHTFNNQNDLVLISAIS